jgi:hypothetical protein
MSKVCNSIRELRDKVAEHYGKEPVQLTSTCQNQKMKGRPAFTSFVFAGVWKSVELCPPISAIRRPSRAEWRDIRDR